MADIRQPPVAVTTTAQDYEEDRLPTDTEVDDYEREATELTNYDAHDGTLNGPRHRSRGQRRPQETKKRRLSVRERVPLLAPFISFWNQYIHLTVPHEGCRDHLGKLTTNRGP